ncbi:MAG: ABC transporter substrate-binding protein, partial [Ilumatobacteraceae bacterium]
MRRTSPLWAVAGAVGGLLAAVVGCSSDAAPATTTAQPSTTTIARVDDGTLTIGLLTPQGSANADIGQAIANGVNLAVRDINLAGGYGGKNIVLVPADEGV